MAEYKISGVWLDAATGQVTHYAFHQVLDRTILQAEKKSKAEAIKILETSGNIAETWIWDYEKATWAFGNIVEIGWTLKGKFLRCADHYKATEDLKHLINYSWIKF